MQVLRATAKLSTTILYIPLVTTVVQLFNCNTQTNKWEVTGWTCYTGVHLVIAIIAAVAILCFSVFSFAGNLQAPLACSWNATGTAGQIHTLILNTS